MSSLVDDLHHDRQALRRYLQASLADMGRAEEEGDDARVLTAAVDAAWQASQLLAHVKRFQLHAISQLEAARELAARWDYEPWDPADSGRGGATDPNALEPLDEGEREVLLAWVREEIACIKRLCTPERFRELVACDVAERLYPALHTSSTALRTLQSTVRLCHEAMGCENWTQADAEGVAT